MEPKTERTFEQMQAIAEQRKRAMQLDRVYAPIPKEFREPSMCRLLIFCGIFCVIVALIALFAGPSIPAAVSFVVAGVVAILWSQLLLYLARTAYFAERTVELLQAQQGRSPTP